MDQWLHNSRWNLLRGRRTASWLCPSLTLWATSRRAGRRACPRGRLLMSTHQEWFKFGFNLSYRSILSCSVNQLVWSIKLTIAYSMACFLDYVLWFCPLVNRNLWYETRYEHALIVLSRQRGSRGNGRRNPRGQQGKRDEMFFSKMLKSLLIVIFWIWSRKSYFF